MSAWIHGVRAVMGRRILMNFRVRPAVLERLVPRPFRVKVVRGWGLAGVCLIRLERMRPEGLPEFVGLGSENAAHRIAIEWMDRGLWRDGVFIPRRDTDSLVNRWVGGRLFPGVHHPAAFQVVDDGRRVRVGMRSFDGTVSIEVDAERTDDWQPGSVFGTLEEASEFFRGGNCGWSPSGKGKGHEGVELRPERWEMRPLRIRHAASSYFSDLRHFPAGSVEVDSAILMQGIPHAWRDLGRIEVGSETRMGRPRQAGHGVSALFRMP